VSPAASLALEAGAASRVVTPIAPVYLAGLRSPRVSDGVHDDLFARALAISDGGTTAILVGVDVIGYSRQHVERVKQALSARGVPADGLVVCATHQHSGPDTIGIWGPSETQSGVDPSYMAQLTNGIVDAAEAAFRSLRPARVSFGVATIPDGVVHNVRVSGYHDKEVRALRFTDADDNTIGTLVNFTAHPETLWSDSTKITADYPAYVYRLLDETLGGTTVFINGALGGMVTVDEKERTFAEAERIGTAVAATAIAAIRTAEPVEATEFAVRRSAFRTRLDNERFRLAATNGVIPLILDGDTLRTEVNLIRFGRVVMATVPGELLPKLGFAIRDAIRERLGVASPFLLGLANDELGYILAEEDFDLPLYQYEASMSVSRHIGTEVVERLMALMSR
jgi:hypothetical protein